MTGDPTTMSTTVCGATANLPRGAALVTGAARGMGHACALALGRQGFPVVANDFNAGQLAVYQDIPAELYEAAALDGATGGRAVRYVTWPLLRPVVSVVLALGVESDDVEPVLLEGRDRLRSRVGLEDRGPEGDSGRGGLCPFRDRARSPGRLG